MLRRACQMAALSALLVPAVAGTATAQAAKAPVVTQVAPMDVFVGQTLTLRGRNFRTGIGKNTVAFKRKGAKVVFVRSDKSTKKMLKVKLPKRLEKSLPVANGKPVATRLQLRVLSTRFGRRFTSVAMSPIVGPEPQAPPRPSIVGPQQPPTSPTSPIVGPEKPPVPPNADCDNDGVANSNDADDDNDLLSDAVEAELSKLLDACRADTDGDGVEDGYEYQSALDLNDDRYQGDPSLVQPYPVKQPYPNPLFKDAQFDYDGDSLTLAEEQALWKYTYEVNHSATRTLEPLSYTDGMQHSVHRFESGRNVPALPVEGYARRAEFDAWATSSRYRAVLLPASRYFDSSYTGWHDIRDVNLQNGVETSDIADDDYNRNGFLSDNERDEDADGLTNYVEAHGQLTRGYWAACYPMETPWQPEYAGTRLDDPDTDGDGVRDGADDQDHDDLPNLMELSRILASGGLGDRDPNSDKPCTVNPDLELGVDLDGDGEMDIENVNHPGSYGRVNPFNS